MLADGMGIKTDIELLNDKIIIYHKRFGALPTARELELGKVVNMLGERRGKNDGDIYYEIDITQLGNVSLNYGTKKDGENDIYIINSTTFNIYYLKGI